MNDEGTGEEVKRHQAEPIDQFELEFQQDDPNNLEGYGQAMDDNGSQSEGEYDYLQQQQNQVNEHIDTQIDEFDDNAGSSSQSVPSSPRQ